MNKKVTAVLPIKYNSQRVPGKNFRLFHGKPLFTHIIATLKAVADIDSIVVNVDSCEVEEKISLFFNDIVIYHRPKELCGDDVSVNLILEEMLPKIEGEMFIQTHVTNPCLQSTTISEAINCFAQKSEKNDACFSVTKHFSRFYTSNNTPINHDPQHLIQTQDLPPLYEDNSCFYIFPRNTFMRHTRTGKNPLLYPINKLEAIDIDTEEDFILAEHIFNILQKCK